MDNGNDGLQDDQVNSEGDQSAAQNENAGYVGLQTILYDRLTLTGQLRSDNVSNTEGAVTWRLGSVLSVQIWEKALAAIPDLEEQFERGEFGQLHEWLRTNLYVLGSRFTPAETIERVVGGPIDPQPYLRYLGDKLGTLTAA